MDEPDSKKTAHELRRWELSPEQRGALKLVLQYDPNADAADDREGSLQLLLPPEAALHLADELSRQAHRSLEQLGRGLSSPGWPGKRQ